MGVHLGIELVAKLILRIWSRAQNSCSSNVGFIVLRPVGDMNKGGFLRSEMLLIMCWKADGLACMCEDYNGPKKFFNVPVTPECDAIRTGHRLGATVINAKWHYAIPTSSGMTPFQARLLVHFYQSCLYLGME